MRFHCRQCGQWHEEVPLSFDFDEPVYIATLDAATRARSVKALPDYRELRIDGERHFFVLGRIAIPILDTAQQFTYGVWTSLSEPSYAAARRGEPGPFFGWLSNDIPGYPSTMNIATNAHLVAGARASLELDPTSEHALARDVRSGITMARVEEAVARLLHQQ